MPEYKIEITKSAGKELQKIPRLEQNRIIKSIRCLAKDPRPAGLLNLQVMTNTDFAAAITEFYTE